MFVIAVIETCSGGSRGAVEGGLSVFEIGLGVRSRADVSIKWVPRFPMPLRDPNTSSKRSIGALSFKMEFWELSRRLAFVFGPLKISIRKTLVSTKYSMPFLEFPEVCAIYS